MPLLQIMRRQSAYNLKMKKMDWSIILIIYLDYKYMDNIEKLEVKEEFNGIDDIKNTLSNVINKINEIIDLANEKVNE